MPKFNNGVVTHPAFVCHRPLLTPVNIKNAKYEQVIEALPEYTFLLAHLFSLIPSKQYQLVDILFSDLNIDQATCVDTGWHLDGKMNNDNQEQYVMWCYGEDGLRTAFHTKTINYPTDIVQPNTIEGRHALFSRILGHSLDNEDADFTTQIPNQTPVSYTTFDFHKGRIATKPGSRILIRVMCSDTIRPKHKRF